MSDAEVTLYGLGLSTFVRTARLALEEKGVAYTVQPADFGSDALRAVHPFARMPAFRHGDYHLYETGAICEYVDEAFAGPSLRPTTPRERASMRQWTSAAASYLYPHAVGAVVLPFFTAQMAGRAPDMEAIRGALPRLRETLRVFDHGLDGRPWFCGSVVTLADLFAFPILDYLRMIPDAAHILSDTHHLNGFVGRMSERASAAATKPM